MKKSNKGFALFLAILPLAGTALALDSDRSADEGYAVRRQVAAERAAQMEATCREEFVDVDEGYGVSNRESRVVCDNR